MSKSKFYINLGLFPSIHRQINYFQNQQSRIPFVWWSFSRCFAMTVMSSSLPSNPLTQKSQGHTLLQSGLPLLGMCTERWGKYHAWDSALQHLITGDSCITINSRQRLVNRSISICPTLGQSKRSLCFYWIPTILNI